MKVVYRTATSLNGFLADEHDSLAWLFAVPGPRPDHESFLRTVTTLVCGSTTYEWVLREADLLADPDTWRDYFGQRPMFVFSTRELPVPDGADVRVLQGPVENHLDAIERETGDGVCWVQGGGDLAGQFLDAGRLDQLLLTVAPAALTGGAPLLPRNLGSDRLRLRGAEQVGEFAVLTYEVQAPPAEG